MGDTCCYCGARRVDRQLGLEATPDDYVQNMVAVFREVRRVLRRDGTCWLNLGDSYANDTKWGGTTGGKHVAALHGAAGGLGREKRVTGLKAKDLVGIPWRVAFALQADGWYLRADVIWSKPNPMPESVSDRPTKAHEYLFLLTRSPRYFYDADAIREPWNGVPGLTGGAYAPPGQSPHGNARGPDGRSVTRVLGQDGSAQHRDGERWPNPGGRNRRSVWEIATEPYPDAHFATFPQALVEPCVKAGTSERGCCPECGAPWERETVSETHAPPERQGNRPIRYMASAEAGAGQTNLSRSNLGMIKRTATSGWRPTCAHEERWPNVGEESQPRVPHDPVPCTVLDIFMGSGTTAQVARRLGRRSIGIELSPEYAELAARRLGQQSLFALAPEPVPLVAPEEQVGLHDG